LTARKYVDDSTAYIAFVRWCAFRSNSFLPWFNKNNIVVNIYLVVEYMYDGITFNTSLTMLRISMVISLREKQFLLGSSNESKRIELNLAGACVIPSTIKRV